MYLLMPARAFRRKHESTPGKRDEKFARKTAGEERRAYREGTREREGERGRKSLRCNGEDEKRREIP